MKKASLAEKRLHNSRALTRYQGAVDSREEKRVMLLTSMGQQREEGMRTCMDGALRLSAAKNSDFQEAFDIVHKMFEERGAFPKGELDMPEIPPPALIEEEVTEDEEDEAEQMCASGVDPAEQEQVEKARNPYHVLSE